MNNKWDKILLELSYRVSSGIPDLSNEQHLMKLWDILKEHNWNIDARVELLKRLDEQGKERPCPICESQCQQGQTTALTGCISKSGGGKQTSGQDEPTDKKSKKPKDKKKKLKKKRSKEERAQRVKDDLTSINEIEDDKEAHKKMREKQAERRDEIYKGADFPAGNEGSVTGENGGGIALQSTYGATDGHFARVAWDKDAKQSGWTVANSGNGGASTAYSITTTSYSTGAPSGNLNGVGGFHFDTANDNLYVRISD